MACIRSIFHRTRGDFPSARVIDHTPIAPEIEQEVEVRPSRIHLLYQDVCKFQHDGSNASKIPKMLWKMLKELGYKKQLKYYEHKWHMKALNLCGMFKSTSSPHAISRSFWCWEDPCSHRSKTHLLRGNSWCCPLSFYGYSFVPSPTLRWNGVWPLYPTS
jgi:hypothetical protein